MSWVEDVSSLWLKYGQAYPRAFILGWIRVEESNNAAPPTPLGEVGWFQIMPSEAQSIGVDLARVPGDKEYSFQAGIKLLDHYAERVDADAFSGDAYFGMVKLWHALPLLAKLVTNELERAAAWSDVSEWIKSNVTSSDLAGHSPSKWATNVDKVLAYGASLEAGIPSAIVPLANPEVAVPALIGLCALAVMAWLLLARKTT